MPKFLLIDHSLHSVGGHHFEYALHVLRAAERAGLQIWLATNRRFRDQGVLPTPWQVRPVYRYSTYTRHRFAVPPENAPATRRSWLPQWIEERWRTRRRRQRAAAFARDTAALLKDIDLEPGDQVFVPTLSELDLLGLAQYLARDERTRRVDWHLQFHFPIFRGCEPDYAAQDKRVEPLRQTFRDALALAGDRRLYFYTTTEQLTAQFNRLDVAAVQTLPYPVNSLLAGVRQQSAAERPGPLRIVSLGDARHEKGFQHLPAIVDRLWPNYLETGRAQFLIQANMAFPQPPQKQDIVVAESVAALRRRAGPRIALLDQSLGSEEFRQLAQSADVGLLLYDREIYFARCSGVLVELLSAAVPVLVSPGCWMADQLAETTCDYHMSLRHNGRLAGKSRLERGTAIDVPAGSSDLLLFFLWPNQIGQANGAYVRVESAASAADGRELGRWTAIIGPAAARRWGTALVRIPLGATSIRIDWSSAYGNQPVLFQEAEACFMAADVATALPTPRGAVGLVAASPDQAPELLADLIDNHAHYRRTAAAFARGWSAWHNPDRVVAELLSQRPAIPLTAPRPTQRVPLARRG